MFSDECDVLDFSLNDSNVNSISLWFLPMLLSLAVNSSRLCWHRSCEISTRAVTVCLPLKSTLFTVAAPYPPSFFISSRKKADVTLLGLGQDTTASISLALPLASDQTICSAVDGTCDPHKCLICVCNSDVCIFRRPRACVCL